jgi:hypothetical protein
MRCPADASKISIPTFPGEFTVTLWVAPDVVRPVNATSAAIWGLNGMKKSWLLWAVPFAVAIEICPDPEFGGTFIAMLVELADAIGT